MQMESSRNNSGLPGAGSNDVTRTLLSNTQDTGRKKELVVLIRPTVIRSNEDWERTTQEAMASLEEAAGPRRVVTVAAPAGPAAAAPAVPATAPAAGAAPAPAAGPQTIAAAQRR
jgi:MSHA biogenesis protein MshL